MEKVDSLLENLPSELWYTENDEKPDKKQYSSSSTIRDFETTVNELTSHHGDSMYNTLFQNETNHEKHDKIEVPVELLNSQTSFNSVKETIISDWEEDTIEYWNKQYPWIIEAILDKNGRKYLCQNTIISYPRLLLLFSF